MLLPVDPNGVSSHSPVLIAERSTLGDIINKTNQPQGGCDGRGTAIASHVEKV